MATSLSHDDGSAPLREARARIGLSQRELAAALECSHTAVGLWERGGVPERHADTVERALRALTVEPVSPVDVRLLRRRTAISQADLAHRLGVSKALVVAWEGGQVRIRPRHARRLRAELERAPNLAVAVRDWHGWTDADLGRELGVSGGRAAQWVHGAALPAKYAARLAELALAEPQAPTAAELSAWRARRKLSAAAVARSLGAHRSRISEWERGEPVPARYRGALRRLMRARRDGASYERQVLELIESSPGRYTAAQLERKLGRAGAVRSALASLERRGEVHRRRGVYEDMPGRPRMGQLFYPRPATSTAPRVPGGRLPGWWFEQIWRGENDARRGIGAPEIGAARLAQELGVSRTAVRLWKRNGVPRARQEKLLLAFKRLRAEPASRRPPGPAPATVAAELSALRGQAGVTQAWLAERLGLRRGQAAVSAWERGAVRVPEPVAAKIQRVLAEAAVERVTADYLRGGRARAGWTQRELASRLGVKRDRVRRWESGSAVPCQLWGHIRTVLESAPAREAGVPMAELQQKRGELGWSQRELAERLGVWPADVSRWERGAAVPPAIRNALVRELESGVPAPDPVEELQARILTAAAAEPGLSRRQVMRRVHRTWSDTRGAIEALQEAGAVHVRPTRYLDRAGRRRSRPGLYPGVGTGPSAVVLSAPEIVRRREELRWSQAELARRLGISQSILWHWEHGRAAPDAEQAAELERILTEGAREGVDARLDRLEEQLRPARERVGLSRSGMARALAVDRGTYAAWESGTRPVASWRRREVLAALDRLTVGP